MAFISASYVGVDGDTLTATRFNSNISTIVTGLSAGTKTLNISDLQLNSSVIIDTDRKLYVADTRVISIANDGNPSFFIGSTDSDSLKIQAIYTSGTTTLASVAFKTFTAGGTADDGQMVFSVDEVSRFTINDAGISTSGTLSVTGATTLTGDLAVATNKFTVAAASGNTSIAGTLGVTSDLAVNTNKFTVAASTGNTSIAGTLGVTGAITGTLATAAQGNITSLGTLSALTISGNLTVDTDTLFVDSANNRVGVGTTSPLTKLHIDGGSSAATTRISNSNSASFVVLNLSEDTSGTNSISLARYGSTYATSSIRNALDITTSNGGNILLRPAGNVGIGTTSPAEKLTVAGSVLSTGDYKIDTWGTGIGVFGSASGHNLIFPAGGATFRQNTTATLHIADAGNVGIGTASPTTKLHISATMVQDSIIRMTVSDGTADKRNWEMRVIGATGYEGFHIRKVNDANTVYDSKFVILDNGNVGIGTTSPAYTLDVNGIIKSNNGIISKGLGSLNASSIYMEQSNSALGRIIVVGANDSTLGTFSISQYSSAAGLQGTPFHINNSGNVGIGTTSPAVPLQVHGVSDTTGGTVRAMSTNSLGVDLGGSLAFGGVYTTGGATTVWADISGKKENATSADVAGYLAFGTRVSGGLSTERMRITSSGNVGIGTTSPAYKFQINPIVAGSTAPYTTAVFNAVSQGANPQYIRLLNGGDSDYNAYIKEIYSTGETMILGTENSGTEYDTIAMKAGNVGIGTASPVGKLHVASGDIHLDSSRGIFASTSDGSDSYRIDLFGGGASGPNRGGGLNLYGNESAGTGRVYVQCGLGDSGSNHGYFGVANANGSFIAQFGNGSSATDKTIALNGDTTVTGSISSTNPFCSLSDSTSQAVTSVETVVTFATEVSDTSGMHSTSSNTGRITIATEGVYHVEGRVKMQNFNATSNYLLWCRRYNSGGTLQETTSHIQNITAANLNGDSYIISTMMLCSAGDYIVMSSQTGGGTADIRGDLTLSTFQALKVR